MYWESSCTAYTTLYKILSSMDLPYTSQLLLQPSVNPTDTSVSPCFSSPTATVTMHTHVCWKIHPKTHSQLSPRTSYPSWAAGSTSCSWVAANQTLAAGWLSSNTANFICLWFFFSEMGWVEKNKGVPPLFTTTAFQGWEAAANWVGTG